MKSLLKLLRPGGRHHTTNVTAAEMAAKAVVEDAYPSDISASDVSSAMNTPRHYDDTTIPVPLTGQLSDRIPDLALAGMKVPLELTSSSEQIELTNSAEKNESAKKRRGTVTASPGCVSAPSKPAKGRHLDDPKVWVYWRRLEAHTEKGCISPAAVEVANEAKKYCSAQAVAHRNKQRNLKDRGYPEKAVKHQNFASMYKDQAKMFEATALEMNMRRDSCLF